MITIRNNFHGTAVKLRPVDGRLSARQIERARKTLCSMSDCTCSGTLGERGPNPEIEINQDRNGNLSARVVGA